MQNDSADQLKSVERLSVGQSVSQDRDEADRYYFASASMPNCVFQVRAFHTIELQRFDISNYRRMNVIRFIRISGQGVFLEYGCPTRRPAHVTLSADIGRVSDEFRHAIHVLSGRDVAKSRDEAECHFKLAADDGNSALNRECAERVFSGIDVRHDLDVAVRILNCRR
jgi:hypothetical protein